MTEEPLAGKIDDITAPFLLDLLGRLEDSLAFDGLAFGHWLIYTYGMEAVTEAMLAEGWLRKDQQGGGK